MSFTALLNDEVTIYNPDGAIENRYGDEVTSFDAGVSVAARVQPASEDEIDDRTRDTRTQLLTMFTGPDAPISSLSEVLHDGTRYRVLGPPQIHDGQVNAHHLEITLEGIEG